MALLEKIFGNQNAKELKKIQPIVDEINGLEDSFRTLSDTELKNKTAEFKKRLQNGETVDDILPEAFANVREAARRVLGQRHYDVQLMGGIVLHRGMIAEMRTGEGKTLTSTLPVYLNSLTGDGVHIVTVNDYLARRDADWMGTLYHWLGLTIGCIQNQRISYLFDPGYQTRMQEEEAAKGITENEEDAEASWKVDMDNLRLVERAESYKADITYGTNNEFGFDYLRDNMVQDVSEKTQGKLAYAIIDEVDSILIDEARTPLIISGQAAAAAEQYYRFAQLVRELEENTDYNIDEKMRVATLTQDGITKMEKLLDIENIYEEGGVTIVHHIEQALKAHTLFKNDRDYVVKENEVVIVDEFTGRMMPGRRYSEGLHQAIEAKEGLEIKRESRTLATITFQNLFRLYNKLSGMTGTAETEKEEFYKIYQLDVVVIPTNKPIARKDVTDAIYRTEDGKIEAVIEKIKDFNEKGNPVLIGTISIESNELLSQALTKAGVKHQMLNAKNHESEAEVVAQAGKRGAVTLATNMAGRGVDIVLGGNPVNSEEAAAIKELGGLVVLGTERHDSRRIDNQLRGRAGRQGDPGYSQFFVSMEDNLMRVFATDRVKSMMQTLKWPENMPIENKIVSRSIETAQKKVEGRNFDIREHIVKYDDVMNKHRDVVYKKRDEVLEANSEEMRKIILELIEIEIENVVSFHTNLDNENKWDIKEIYETVHSIFPIEESERKALDNLQSEAGDKLQDAHARTSIVEYITELAHKRYEDMLEGIENKELIFRVERGFYLRAIDNLWVEHLDQMAYLREHIGLRGYGQRDPLIEYKKEAYGMFTELLTNIQKQVVYSIYKLADVQQLAPAAVQSAKQQLQGAEKNMHAYKHSHDHKPAPAITAKRKDSDGKKIGRNQVVTIQRGEETQTMKYKKAEPLIESGEWTLTSVQ